MENIAYFARKKITMDKFVSQVKITTSSSISKILNIQGDSVISSCDLVNGFVSLSGKINISVIYLNNENNIEHTNMMFDFIEKQQTNYNIEDVFAEDKVEVKNVNFSGTEIICVFEHSLVLNGHYKYEFPIISDEDNQIVTKKSKFEALKYVTSCEEDFVIAEETEVNLSNITVITTTAKVILYETNCLVDKVLVDGKIIANIVYKDEQGIASFNKEFEFKQEISAEGVVPNMILSTFSNVKNVNIVAEANELKTNLVCSFDVYIKGIIYEENTYEYVDDIFSLKNKISSTIDYIEAKSFSVMKNYSDTFMLSTDISNIENFDDVIGVYLPKFEVENIEEFEDKSLLTGTIYSNALYRADNNLSSLNTSLPVRIEISRESSELVGRLDSAVEITSYKVKAGKYLEIVYVLNYGVIFEKSISASFVKNYELKGEKPENTGGIKLYITSDGETLFQVAKSLNVKPEVISSQNEVGDIFEQGEKIYVYSPINLLN